MPTREIIRIETEREDGFTLPSDCIIRPHDGRKPFIVRERHLMMPAIEETSTNLSTLTVYRGDRAPESKDIAFERRNGEVYATLIQSQTTSSEVDDGSTSFITTVRFKEELRSLPQPVVVLTNPTIGPVVGPSIASLPQAPSAFTQPDNGSTYFTFSRANTMPIAPLAVPQPPPALVAGGPNLPPPPAIAHAPLLHPAAPFPAVGASTPASTASPSTSHRRFGLFGAFSRFFEPETPPLEYWQHYQDTPYIGIKRKWCDDELCESSSSKRIRKTLLIGGAVVLASALFQAGVIEAGALPWKPIESSTSMGTPWLHLV
ncbi:hypothetical protein CPB83DRAFT_298215 [Crepidotus variabilis]|uniref:Uncharacterized protein n=1 Tax=Crepidotus variabilis TaxID=179855 RepID=A0A9P6EH07_9AGAR|nr:hypothetical protein CPB83DRAFT_298215 [Crepidotus variabilis]